jgi:hypothetical protein
MSMSAWTLVRERDPYAGAVWAATLTLNDRVYHLTVTEDLGPVDVGFGIPTFQWEVWTDSTDYALASRKEFRAAESAMVAARQHAYVLAELCAKGVMPLRVRVGDVVRIGRNKTTVVQTSIWPGDPESCRVAPPVQGMRFWHASDMTPWVAPTRKGQ